MMDKRTTALVELLSVCGMTPERIVLMAKIERIMAKMQERRQWFILSNEPLQGYRYEIFVTIFAGDMRRNRHIADTFEEALAWIVESYEEWERETATL